MSVIMTVTAFNFTNAQTVVTNDYTTPVTEETIQQDLEEKSSFYVISFDYFTFKGIDNFGVSFSIIKPNTLGLKYSFRSQFKKYGNYSFDIGFNWAFQLWKQDNMALYFVPALGASMRIQSVPKMGTTYDKNLKKIVQSLQDESEFGVDPYFNPSLIFKYDKLVLSAGYYLWSIKAKFSDGYLKHGFQAGIGYAF